MRWTSPKIAESHNASTAILLAAGIGLLLLVLFGRMPGDGRWVGVVGNAAHGPAFGLFALLVIGLLRRLRQQAALLWNYLVAFVVAVAAGGLIELLQYAIGRDASLDDLLRDVLGTVTGLTLIAVLDVELGTLAAGRAVRRVCIPIACIGVALIIAPFITTVWAYVGRDRDFPQLVDFDSPVSTYFIAPYSAALVDRQRLPAYLAANAGHVKGLRARVSVSDRWAIALWEPSPDWREFEWLALDIANPTGNNLSLRIRIRDRDQRGTRPAVDLGTIEVLPRSRATRRLSLRQHAAERDINPDYGAVRGVIIRGNRENLAQEFYLMRMWLE